MIARMLFLGALLLLPGCELSTQPEQRSDPALEPGLAAQVTFRAERSQYNQGDTAAIVLRNGSAQTVGYNFCMSARELRTDGTWKRFEPLRSCAAVVNPLAPATEAVLREPITAEWNPGEYRMVATLWLPNARTRTEVFTPSFTVLP